jgi:flagellar motility protein MotE (MotC chaperone)
MKKLLTTLSALLALNFLVVAGGVGWLFQSGHVDRARVNAIKELLFPPPAASAPAAQPADAGPAPASKRMQDLLAKHAGRSAAQQVDFIQQTFDATLAQLDRREREVADRERQVASANAKLVDDRKTLEAERQRLTNQEREFDRLASDKGFQDTLSLYNTMPGRQVKGVFMTMDEASAAQYLDAMEPRTATKILKEFKSPDEADRMKRILEKMRHPPGSAAAATQPGREQR